MKSKQMPAPSVLLSIPDFCREFSVSKSEAYRLLRTGEMAGVKVGRLTRIRRSEAEAWVARLARYEPGRTAQDWTPQLEGKRTGRPKR